MVSTIISSNQMFLEILDEEYTIINYGIETHDLGYYRELINKRETEKENKDVNKEDLKRQI